jgi:hypothetical protein
MRINLVLPLPDTDSGPTGSLEISKPLRCCLGAHARTDNQISTAVVEVENRHCTQRAAPTTGHRQQQQWPSVHARPPIRPLVRRYSHTFALVATCTAFLAAKFIARLLSLTAPDVATCPVC